MTDLNTYYSNYLSAQLNTTDKTKIQVAKDSKEYLVDFLENLLDNIEIESL